MCQSLEKALGIKHHAHHTSSQYLIGQRLALQAHVYIHGLLVLCLHVWTPHLKDIGPDAVGVMLKASMLQSFRF